MYYIGQLSEHLGPRKVPLLIDIERCPLFQTVPLSTYHLHLVVVV